jgi:hypothetical protein
LAGCIYWHVALYLDGCILLADCINCPVGYDRLKLFIGWSTFGPVASYWVIALFHVSAQFGLDAIRLLSLVAYSVGSVYCPVAVLYKSVLARIYIPFHPIQVPDREGERIAFLLAGIIWMFVFLLAGFIYCPLAILAGYIIFVVAQLWF